MPEARATVGDLLRSLSAQGLLAPEASAIAAARLARQEEPVPWFLKALMAFGGWMAAICFLAFLALTDLIKEPSYVFVGLGLVAGATGLRRVSRNLILTQFCLAVSMTGHWLFLYGVWQPRIFGSGTDWDFGLLRLAVASVLLCAALYFLYRDSIHRFLSCGVALSCLHFWLVEMSPHLIHGLILLETAGTGFFLARRTLQDGARPAAWTCALGLPLSLLHLLDPQLQTPDWPSQVVVGIALAGLVVQIAGRSGGIRREAAVAALAGVVLLATFSAPGILAALGLIALGFDRRDRALTFAGVTALVVFIISFYYSLDLNLGIKSAIMAGSGLVLLMARALLGRRTWARENAA